MLSTLAKGYGSWTGDLEVEHEGACPRKPILGARLREEDTKFVEKTVRVPLRVKSAVGVGLAKVPPAQAPPSLAAPSAASLVDALKDKAPKTQYARPKSVCSSRAGQMSATPAPGREEGPARSKSAGSGLRRKPKRLAASLSATPHLVHHASSPALARRGGGGSALGQDAGRLQRASSVPAAPAEVKVQRPDGQLALPKTFMTRKGALMLFTAPENLTFSEPGQKCYFRNTAEENDVSRLSLTLGTVNKLTSSVLRYGSVQQSDGEGEDSEGEVQQENTHMQFIHSHDADQEAVDYRAQPGADFVFYLRDMESRAVVRNLVRTPSQQSLASVDTAAELTAALHSIDGKGPAEVPGLISPDVKRLAGGSQRWNLSSAGSMRSHSRNAKSRPSTSASGRSTPLSVERIAASLRCSPYLGHPIKAPYPPDSAGFSTTESTTSDLCPRHGAGLAAQGDSVGRQGSAAPSLASRRSPSARSLRSQGSLLSRGSRASLAELSAGAPLGSREDLADVEFAGDDDRCGDDVRDPSIAASHDGNLSAVDGEGSRRGNSARSSAPSPGQQQQWRQGSSQLADDKLIDHDGAGSEAMGCHDDPLASQEEGWAEEPEPYNPVRYYDSRPTSTASRHTYISASTSLPTTVHDDDPFDPSGQPLDGQLDQDLLVVDQDALLLQDDDGREEEEEDEEDDQLDPELEPLAESLASGQWPEARGRSPSVASGAGVGPGSPSAAERLGSPVKSPGPGTKAASPALSVPPAASPDRAEASRRELSRSESRASAIVHTDALQPSASGGPSPATPEARGTVAEVKMAGGPSPRQREANPAPPPPSDKAGPPSSPPTPPRLPPRLPPRKAGMADVVNRAAEEEMGVPYTTLVPRKLGASGDPTMTTAAEAPVSVRRSPSPEVQTTSTKPPQATKKVSKLDLGNLKTMVKPTAAKTKSPRAGRRSKGKGVRPKSTGVQFIESLSIDNYQGPGEDEIEQMVQDELAKELESNQLTGEEDAAQLLAVAEEVPDDAVSLATDDEALERELKRTGEPGKKKSKKSLAKEKAALQEARRQENLRRKEERKELEEKKKQREKEKRRQEIAEQRRIQMAKEELEDAAEEAERAAAAEEEARQMLQETRRLAREEREARRKADAERRRQEKEEQRLERKRMEEAARQREQEMAERLAGASEKRRLREEAEWERQERERLEQEEREMEEEEEKRRQEEEEERIRDLEKEAEEEAITRLVKEREEAERRMRLAGEEAARQREEEERLRLEEERRKAEEAEQRRLAEEEAERKRQGELERIRKIQRLEEEARERVQRELERRRAWALRRREQNQGQRDHLNAVRHSQGMTKPWIFSYYVHWPKENYERRVYSAKKKGGFRARPRPKPKPEAGQGKA